MSQPLSPGVPRHGRLLAIDYGTKRLGFAVCDADQKIASPVHNYDRQSLQRDAVEVRKMVAEYTPVGLVVGLPVHMSGDEGGKAREARQFAAWLGEITGLPIAFADERYSSALAEAHLMGAELTKKQRKARLDKLAAQILLQQFLELPDRDAPIRSM